jgi:curved DNA-binding protein CbpA
VAATLDPFTTLGVDENAGDEEIRRRYLALVRAFPPDRDPERFQAYRAAFEALCDERKRLEAKILNNSDATLARFKSRLLAEAKPFSARASKLTLCALLVDGVARASAPAESVARS